MQLLDIERISGKCSSSFQARGLADWRTRTPPVLISGMPTLLYPTPPPSPGGATPGPGATQGADTGGYTYSYGRTFYLIADILWSKVNPVSISTYWPMYRQSFYFWNRENANICPIFIELQLHFVLYLKILKIRFCWLCD